MTKLSDIREKKTTFEIASKEYSLFYDMNAFAELEEIYGSLEKAMDFLGKGSVKAIINILWAGLIHENENLTKKEVGKLFDLSEMVKIAEVINKAIIKAVPEQNKKEKKDLEKNAQSLNQ